MALMVTHLNGFMSSLEPAFPKIVNITTASQSGVDGCTLALPSGIVSGNLLLVAVCIPSSGPIASPSNPAGMTSLVDTSSSTTLHQRIFYKIMDGTESGNFTCDLTGSSIDCQSWAMTISNMQGTPELSTFTSASTSSPDPASLTPSWGTASPTLYIPALCYDAAVTTTTVSAYPAGYYLSQANNGASTTSVSQAYCGVRKQSASDDPGAYTISAAQRCIIHTIGVRAA